MMKKPNYELASRPKDPEDPESVEFGYDNPMPSSKKKTQSPKSSKSNDSERPTRKPSVEVVSDVPKEIQLNSMWLVVFRYFMLAATLISVFLGSYFAYVASSTKVLVTSSSLSQCSESSEVYAFSGFNQSQLVKIQATDVSGNVPTFPVYLYATFEGEAIGSTDSSFMFTQSSASCGADFDVMTFTGGAGVNVGNGTIGSNTTLVGNWQTSLGTISSYCTNAESSIYDNQAAGIPVWNQDTANAGLFCGASLTYPPGYPQVFALNSVVDCGHVSNISLVTTLVKTDTALTATCQASICGSPISFYSSTRELQPSGVYECTVPENPLTAMSNAFANAHMAQQGVYILVTACLGIWFLGVSGFISYISSGGKF